MLPHPTKPRSRRAELSPRLPGTPLHRCSVDWDAVNKRRLRIHCDRHSQLGAERVIGVPHHDLSHPSQAKASPRSERASLLARAVSSILGFNLLQSVAIFFFLTAQRLLQFDLLLQLFELKILVLEFDDATSKKSDKRQNSSMVPRTPGDTLQVCIFCILRNCARSKLDVPSPSKRLKLKTFYQQLIRAFPGPCARVSHSAYRRGLALSCPSF